MPLVVFDIFITFAVGFLREMISVSAIRAFYERPAVRAVAKVMEALHLVAGYLLLAALVLPFRWQSALLYCFFISYGLDFFAAGRWTRWRWTPDKWWGVAMLLLFCLQPLWSLFEMQHLDKIFTQVLNHRLAFMAFGCMTILGFTPHFRMRYVAATLCTSASLAVLWIVVVRLGLWQFLTDSERTYRFMVERIACFGSHMNFNLYLNVALLSCLYLVCRGGRAARWMALVPFVVIAMALAVTEGRTGMLTGGLLSLGIVFAWFRAMGWRKMGYAVLTVCLLGGGAYALHHVMWVNSHFKGSDVSDNPRRYIWHVAMETIEEHPVLGQGVSDGRMRFVENGLRDADFMAHYAQKNIFENPQWNGDVYVMHPHNAALELWLQFGIVGLVVFVLILGLAPVGVAPERRLFVWLLVGIFLLQATFEIFGSNLTPLSWGLFVSLFRSADYDWNKVG